jgi:hypothetical protein
LLDENSGAATERFKEKLESKGFTVARSTNTEQNYTETKQERDTQAVKDSVGTELFAAIKGLK